VTLRTAVIGVGHLGKQHARIHAALGDEGLTQFVSVCDLNEATARSIGEERGVSWATDWRKLIGEVDAVSLAVPTESHCEIACELLQAGIHVLVEKPIARTLEEADRMINAAANGNALLQVGHLERFNPALVALRPHVRNPVYFEIHRVGEFTARSLDIDVVLDLMIHDLDLIHRLVPGVPTQVQSQGRSIHGEFADEVTANLVFENGARVELVANRAADERRRAMRVVYPDGEIVIDFLARTVTNTTGRKLQSLELRDPLWESVSAFVTAARKGASTLVRPEEACRALETALLIEDALVPFGEIHAKDALPLRRTA